jgi:hypothetical protein
MQIQTIKAITEATVCIFALDEMEGDILALWQTLQKSVDDRCVSKACADQGQTGGSAVIFARCSCLPYIMGCRLEKIRSREEKLARDEKQLQLRSSRCDCRSPVALMLPYLADAQGTLGDKIPFLSPPSFYPHKPTHAYACVHRDVSHSATLAGQPPALSVQGSDLATVPQREELAAMREELASALQDLGKMQRLLYQR